MKRSFQKGESFKERGVSERGQGRGWWVCCQGTSHWGRLRVTPWEIALQVYESLRLLLFILSCTSTFSKRPGVHDSFLFFAKRTSCLCFMWIEGRTEWSSGHLQGSIEVGSCLGYLGPNLGLPGNMCSGRVFANIFKMSVYLKEREVWVSLAALFAPEPQ